MAISARDTMDFFATGGFQQLFSDLNEQVDDFTTAIIPATVTAITTTCVLDDLAKIQNSTACADSCQHFDSYNIESEYYELEDNYTYKYELLNVNDPFVIGITNDAEADYNNNNNNNNSNKKSKNKIKIKNVIIENSELNINEKQLQQSFNLLLPSSNDDDVDMEDADALITREMAEWEEKFLDNYIEIPELIDFLPEKTPLCTELCEHFLQESSTNLKLYRKTKAKTTSNASAFDSENGANDKAFPCTYGDCHKIYAKPAHLKAHLRRHLGEKPYICNWPECTWKFSRSDELARHRRSHSGIKPYKCDYCLKCFARSDHLTKHRKVHERRMLAASKAGKAIDGILPHSVFTVRPGRKRKNQIC